MPEIKLTTWNIKWMNKLFVKDAAKFAAGPKITQRLERIAAVIKDIDPDILGVEEGPKHKKQLKHFVRHHLDSAYDVFTVSSGAQSNHALVRKGIDLTVKQRRETHKIYEYLSRNVEYYTWTEVSKQSSKKIPRKPLVLTLSTKSAPGKVVELMVFHTKSKISDLRSRKQWEERSKKENIPAIVDALESRQQLSGELAAIRRYLTHAILSKRAVGCILVGDLNDGPHRDIFEEKFLITNIVDELRGGFHREEALMHHALKRKWLDPDYKLSYTAKFSDPTRDGKTVEVMLDHIMVSSDIMHGNSPIKLVKSSGTIEHDIFEAHGGDKRSTEPSDHRPVSARFKFT